MIDDILRIPLAILAVFRVTELMVYDDGPFGVFLRFRHFLADLSTSSRARNSGIRTVSTELADWVHCPFCVGVWISVVFAVLILIPSIPGDVIILILGLAGGQSFLQQKVSRDALTQ